MLVGAALRQVFAGGASPPPHDLEIEAYAALVLLNREQMRAAELGGAPSHGSSALIKAGGARAGGHSHETLTRFPVSNDPLSSALLGLKLEEREALLLVVLEGFPYSRAARILKISRSILIARLGHARDKLPTNLQTEPALSRDRPHPPHLHLVK
jgi:RNA polymerase sigma-70 factor (ECF subfamily)